MLIKTIDYVDYNGNPQKETLYFNMTKAEIAAMQVRMDGKFIDHLQSLIAGNHVEALFEEFCNLILTSYGEKSEDGKHFYKNVKMREEFESSVAYSELVAELLQDKKKVRSFTRAILPPDFQNIEIPDEEVSSDATPTTSLASGT